MSLNRVAVSSIQGHNNEDNSGDLVCFNHAEMCALDSMPSQANINVETVFMACENKGECKRISTCLIAILALNL